MNALLTKITSAILGGGEGKLLNAAADLIDKSTFSKEEKEQKKLEFAEMNLADKQHQVEAALKETELILEDIQNSRDANVKIQESAMASWFSKNVGYILDLFLGLVWGAVTIFIIAKALKIAGDNVDMTAVLSIYSTITAVFMMTMSFHRGTSKGSEDKSKELKDIRK